MQKGSCAGGTEWSQHHALARGHQEGRIEDGLLDPFQFADANGAGLALLGQLVFNVENEHSLVDRKHRT